MKNMQLDRNSYSYPIHIDDDSDSIRYSVTVPHNIVSMTMLRTDKMSLHVATHTADADVTFKVHVFTKDGYQTVSVEEIR